MDKIKTSEIAKELGLKSKDIIEKASALGIVIKAASSTITMQQAEDISSYIDSGIIPPHLQVKEKKKPATKTTTKSTTTKSTKTTTKQKSTEKDIKKEKEPEEPEEPKIKPTLSVKKSKQPSKPKEEIKEKTQPAKSNKKTQIKKEKKIQKTTQVKEKITLTTNFQKDAYLEDDNQMYMPDFNSRNEILQKFEKANDLMNKNRVKAAANRPKNPFAKKNTNPERGRSRKKRYDKSNNNEEEKIIEILAHIRIYEFAQKINKEEEEILDTLEELGLKVGKNDFLEKSDMELIAEHFGVKINVITKYIDELKYVEKYDQEAINDTDITSRAPVITIMGHVDHGKTSLLDTIRKTKVTQGEAGGITQHIGAYMIEYKKKNITFIDTPGHAAFDKMRERGSKITDIVILVVAGDDGVKDQTIESIKHAKASNSPIIVAVTKMDKENTSIDKVKSQVSEYGITPSDWGGDVDFIPLSSVTKEGINDLLDTIIIQSEMLECKACLNKLSKSYVLEASIEKGKGVGCTVIVQDGTMSIGDDIICDTVFGKVKAIVDDDGKNIKQAQAGMPVKIYGLNDLPTIGENIVVMKTPKEVSSLAQKIAEHKKGIEMSKSIKVSANDISSFIAEQNLKAFPIIVKADATGSLEAIKNQLEAYRNDEVKVNILSSGIGGISEKDIDLASASSECVIFGFNVRPTGAVKKKAEQNNISIFTYSIIYELLDEVKNMLSGLMSPELKEEHTGQAEVRDVFKTPKGIAVAGCIVADGKVIKGGLARVIRQGVVVCDDNLISSLKRFKDDVNEVKSGYECGIVIENYNDVQAGDVIETFIKKEEKKTFSE